MKNLKYIAIGILVGYLVPYIYHLSQNNSLPFPSTKKQNKETSEEGAE